MLLTGTYAYKIKKPVKMDFLDFSTLARREHFCREELRLNRRTAPELYLDVVGIGGSPHRPRVGGGSAFEYAVRMRQFDPRRQLDRLVEERQVSCGDFERLGAHVAALHERAPVARAGSAHGDATQVAALVGDNVAELRRCGVANGGVLAELDRWSGARAAELDELFGRRQAEGRVRECHGDLHLSNLVQLDDGRIVAFDCLEFDPALRWIDAASDVAFLIMDLQHRNRPDLAYAFLNAWLEASGDYEALRVLPYYLTYRTLVRAKVAAIRAGQLDAADASRRGLLANCRRHVELARRYAMAQQPLLVLTHGLSGSGKSWLSARVANRLPAVRLRSDVERKRLAGLPRDASSCSGLEADLYSPAMSRRTYERLAQLARDVLSGGFSVIVDAAFLSRDERARFAALADELGVPWRILSCHADRAVLADRIRRREAAGGDASEADVAVLGRQIDTAEPLDRGDAEHALVVDTAEPPEMTELVAVLRRPCAQSAPPNPGA